MCRTGPKIKIRRKIVGVQDFSTHVWLSWRSCRLPDFTKVGRLCRPLSFRDSIIFDKQKPAIICTPPVPDNLRSDHGRISTLGVEVIIGSSTNAQPRPAWEVTPATFGEVVDPPPGHSSVEQRLGHAVYEFTRELRFQCLDDTVKCIESISIKPQASASVTCYADAVLLHR